MATFIFGSNPLVKEASKQFGLQRLSRFDGLNFWTGSGRIELPAGSTVIVAGSNFPDLEDIQVIKMLGRLNYKTAGQAMMKLSQVGFPVPTWLRWEARKEVPAGFIGRTGEFGGADLLPPAPVSDIAYAACRINTTDEYRVHFCNGKIILAGKKVPVHNICAANTENFLAFQAQGVNAYHSWIRNAAGGWRVDYTQKLPVDVRRFVNRIASVLEISSVVDVGVAPVGGPRHFIFSVGCTYENDPVVSAAYMTQIAKILEGR